MNKFGSFIVIAALVAAPISALAQYKGGDVKDGGSISGAVKFKGTAPAPKKLDVGKDKEVC
ncbi:MAG: carboxypeptidase regulatory-like domain-containing protein, partial [Candidatus Binatia bacterium]